MVVGEVRGVATVSQNTEKRTTEDNMFRDTVTCGHTGRTTVLRHRTQPIVLWIQDRQGKTRMVPEPWTRCPVDKDKYKYKYKYKYKSKYKTRSVLESCTRCSVDKDKKDKARQGEFSTRTRRTLCLLLTRVLAFWSSLPSSIQRMIFLTFSLQEDWTRTSLERKASLT